MISRDEFHGAVFELADNWTESIEVNEYIQFLKRGYEGVYGAFERADRMNFPEEFREFLTGAGVGRARKKLLKKHRKKFQSARREKKGGEKQAPGRSRLRDLELPEEWAVHLGKADDEGASSSDDSSSASDAGDADDDVEPMPEASTCEYVVEVYEAKIAADRKASKANLPPPTLALVALEILQLREMQLTQAKPDRGSQRSSSFPKAGRRSTKPGVKKETGARRSLGVVVRSLCLTLEIANHDSFENDWLWLFSRLIGCYTRSGRVKAVPVGGATFACNSLSQLLPLLNETKQRLPHGVKTPLQGMVKSGKNQAYVGYVGYQAVKHWLRTTVFATLSLRSRRHEHLRNAALATLSRASTPLAVIVERQRLDAEESKKDDAPPRRSARKAAAAAKLGDVAKYGKKTLLRAREAAGAPDRRASTKGAAPTPAPPPRRSRRSGGGDDDAPPGGAARATEKLKAARRRASAIAPTVREDKRAQATSYGDVTISRLTTSTDVVMLVVNLWCATNHDTFNELNESLKNEQSSDGESSDGDDESDDKSDDDDDGSVALQTYTPKTPGTSPRPPGRGSAADDAAALAALDGLDVDEDEGGA